MHMVAHCAIVQGCGCQYNSTTKPQFCCIIPASALGESHSIVVALMLVSYFNVGWLLHSKPISSTWFLTQLLLFKASLICYRLHVPSSHRAWGMRNPVLSSPCSAVLDMGRLLVHLLARPQINPQTFDCILWVFSLCPLALYKNFLYLLYYEL